MNDLYASERKAPSLAPQMSIVYRVIDQRKPDPANPRRHSERRIRNTINAFGFGARIRCHRDADVIAGRRRRLAAGALRITGATLYFARLAPGQARHAAIGQIGPALNDLGAGAEAVNAV
jgi:hypothetical protein